MRVRSSTATQAELTPVTAPPSRTKPKLDVVLPRSNAVKPQLAEAPRGWLDRVGRIFQEHKGALGAVMMGATAIPTMIAPSVAHAEPAPQGTSNTDVTRDILFGPTRTSDTAVDLRRLESTLPDGRRINLFPSDADMSRWIADGALAKPIDRPLDRLLTGVSPEVRAHPWEANFDHYFRARAAVSEVPTALAGMALRPVADGLYKVVDEIPAPIRRPFDRSLGILLDNAVSLPANLLTSRIPLTNGQPPASAMLDLPAYPQMKNSCGETMVATWLKGNGIPVALGEVDTQTSFFEGTNQLMDADLRARGLSLVSGPGTMQDLETYLAHGYPVMVSVGWPDGGGHYAVVTGYDRNSQTVTIDGYRADGKVAKVPYSEFQADWGRHLNLMTVAHPQHDARLGELRAAGKISRTAKVQEGLSISDIWVTQRLDFFVEAAYRYRGTHDDLTVKLSVLSSESKYSDADMFGGSIRYSHRFDDDTTVDFYAERIPQKGPADTADVQSILRNTAIYVGARHGAVSARAGYERGSFQASLQAELTRRLMTVGAEARVSVGPEGHYNVFIGAAGTF